MTGVRTPLPENEAADPILRGLRLRGDESAELVALERWLRVALFCLLEGTDGGIDGGCGPDETAMAELAVVSLAPFALSVGSSSLESESNSGRPLAAAAAAGAGSMPAAAGVGDVLWPAREACREL